MLATAPLPKKSTPPPEEFWQRYSPHHEFPLSSITSATLHLLVIALLLLGAWVAIRLGFGNQREEIPIVFLEISEGTPNGAADRKGIGEGLTREEVGMNPTRPVEPVELVELPESNLDPIHLPKYKDDEGKRLIDPGAVNPSFERIKQLDKEIREKLTFGLGGRGARNGSPNGSPDGKQLSRRIKRLLRWTMIFNTRDGNDYATQLDALGAILAVPDPVGKEYQVIRDLKTRPVQGKVEDLATIQRIYWIDDKPDSVAGLARALDMKTRPRHIFAFFPIELEDKLAQLERDYGGLKEDDIAETRFEIVRGPTGFEPKVTFQSAKR
jgi:hypothetical protein